MTCKRCRHLRKARPLLDDWAAWRPLICEIVDHCKKCRKCAKIWDIFQE